MYNLGVLVGDDQAVKKRLWKDIRVLCWFVNMIKKGILCDTQNYYILFCLVTAVFMFCSIFSEF